MTVPWSVISDKLGRSREDWGEEVATHLSSFQKACLDETLAQVTGELKRVEKRLRFGGSKNLALRMNVFNLFNVSTVTARTVASGSTFGRVTSILRGRLIEFNFAYDW